MACYIFNRLRYSSKEEAKAWVSATLNESDGILKVAEAFVALTLSSSGSYINFNRDRFSEIIDIEILQEKVREVCLDDQPVYIQAILKSILDGHAYQLKDDKLGKGFILND